MKNINVTPLALCLVMAIAVLTMTSMRVQAAPGNAAQFTSDSNSVIAATSSTELKTFSALTLEAWIKPNGSREWALIMGKQYNPGDGNPWYSYRLCKTNSGTFPDTVNFNIAPVSTGGENGVTSTTVVQNDTWTHVAGVYDGTTMKIYINGTLENMVNQTGDLKASDLPMYIGKAPWTNYNNFNGQMDELRIWNVARSQEQIRYSMNRSLAGNEEGLVAYWPFNDAAGSPTADDASQNNHVGTLYNGAAIVADSTAPVNMDFIAQTGMPVSTTIVSNPITVISSSSPAAISITNGEYSISTEDGSTWADWTSVAGTVSVNDQVKVRQTSSSINSTMTTATLTIVGMNDEFFNVTTAAADDPNASGLVAWWRAEDNAFDSVGGNHGTMQNGAAFAVGEAGQAFSMDGVDDYVNVPNSSLWNFGSNDFSIDLRVKFDQTKDNFLIAHDEGSGNQNKWAFYAGNGYLNFHLNSPGTGPISIGYGSIPFSYNIGQWYNLAVARNGATYTFYVNGAPVGTVTDSHVIPDANAPLTIGEGEGTHYVDGSIDEVKIYNRALSELEVSTLAGTKPDAFSFTAQTGMPLSTSIISNPITVAGIDYPAAISIAGGEYQINGGSWTSSSGTVANDDTVLVRQTTSASISTLTTATLTIGGVGGAFNVTTAASGDPRANGLVSWWQAENNAYDSVGAHPGTTAGGVSFDTGSTGQGFGLDGSNDSVDVGNWFNLQSFTISLWINPGASQQQYADIIDNNHWTGRSWVMQQDGSENPNQYVFGAASATGAAFPTVYFTLPANQWTHVTVTRDAATHVGTIYLNGIALPSVTGDGDIFYDAVQNLNFGRHESLGRYWSGRLDEIQIYNRPLSAKEVLKLANPNGPVSWWRGEDNAGDSIGNNDGTWQGTPTYGLGITGKALVFDGVDNYVQISAHSGSLDISSGHSLDLWIKLDGYPTTAAYILNKWVSGVEDKLLVVLPDGRVGYYLHNAFGGSGVVSPTKLVIGRWYHLAATYDGSYARLYINSSLDAVKVAPGAVSNGGGALYLGFNPERNAIEPHDHLKGTVDEIKWHNRALSASEVASSYGLVSWWKGEDNASDSVGSNHGTAVNGATYADGKAGRAFSFNGVDGNYVSIPDNSSLRISSDVTVSVYIKRSGSGNGAEGGIITKGASMVNGVDVPSNYFLEIDGSDHLVAGFERADGTNALLAGPAITDLSSFHLIAYVRQGSSHSLYMDGVQVATESFAGVPGDTTGLELTIGAIRESAQYSYVFNGLIDEVKIFNRGLSVVEISQLAGTLPAPFIFNPVTGAPLSASIVSNAVKVAGISNPAPISITGGGEYRINGGECTATSANVSLGDTVAVCLNSAGAYSTTTSATLTIGGVSGTFTVTTAPDLTLNPVTTPTSLVSQTISGTVKSGATVTVSLRGGTPQVATVVGTEWGYIVTGLVRGENSIYVSASDSGGYAAAKSANINCTAPQLTVTVTGASGISGIGGGTVTSDPSAIACTGGPCAAVFDGGSTVPLTASPDVNSLFGSWSGACSGTGTSCNVLMDSDKSVAASFNYVEPARIQGGEDYPHIADAYAALTGSGTILAREFLFTGGLNLGNATALILKGGYNPAYNMNSAYSTVQGTLTVRRGSLTVERVIVK